VITVLVSACLLGERVRYNGAAATCLDPVLARWMAEGRILAFCPEVAGGLGVPRPAAEIRGAGGSGVLDGLGRVVTAAGADVTECFARGARLALESAMKEHVRLAVLKDGSPSCGSEFIYDGSFTGTRRDGPGVTAALLGRNGIRVFNERQLDAASEFLTSLDEAFVEHTGHDGHEGNPTVLP
jgi:uncharacterized protein YbbK (DUF523 family)